MANQAESRCSESESRGKLEQHVALHYLLGMSVCVAAQNKSKILCKIIIYAFLFPFSIFSINKILFNPINLV